MNLCNTYRYLTKGVTGGQGQNRTADTGIFSPLLYLLSYLAKSMRAPRERWRWRKGGIKTYSGFSVKREIYYK